MSVFLFILNSTLGFFRWIYKDFFFNLFVAIAVLFIIFFCLAFTAGAKHKQSIYQECLLSSHDKFECYEMIYGNR